ncbi:MAG: hypothetical protein ACKO4Z_11435 [Planctomycetota bacterium]
MWSQERGRGRAYRWAVSAAVVGLASAGCKSDLSQQLLERELRYQEDQIYQLQDELHQKCASLDVLSSENASLRRQLGVSPGDTLGRPRGGSPRPANPIAIPPAIEIPEAIQAPTPAATPLNPPTLDNIPPLPVRPSSAPEPSPLSLPEPTAAVPQPVAVPVAFDEPLSDGRPARLVVNLAATSCFDDDGDGRSDGIALTVEPRDAAEKLVSAPGPVSITAFDTGDVSTPLASWSLSDEQAAALFRPTTRLRGLHVPLRWTGIPPSGDHVRLVVRITGPEAAVLETDATVPVR